MLSENVCMWQSVLLSWDCWRGPQLPDTGKDAEGRPASPRLSVVGHSPAPPGLSGLNWRRGPVPAPGHRRCPSEKSQQEESGELGVGWGASKNDKEPASPRSENQFFSLPRSISLEACKGQHCLFKVPPGFTSWVTLGFLHSKHEDPISFPYNSKRSEQPDLSGWESVWL